MTRPRIGISCDFESIIDRRGTPTPRHVLQRSYVDAVWQGGGLPLLLPHLADVDANALLDSIDGLVISGGDFDVPPDYYGQAPRPGLGKLLVERSSFERTLLRAALDRRVPVLGICGGMQLLNVVCGGTLYQDLSEREGTAPHQQPMDRRQTFHAVTLTAGSRLLRICGGDVEVNSTHHQGIDRLGVGLCAAGRAPDGLVEAIELEGPSLALGVQWHPEVLDIPAHRAIYAALVRASADQKRSK